MGKLVSLSRESLEREARWVESMVKSNPSKEELVHFDEEYEKARRISELKRAVDTEADRILRLDAGLAREQGMELQGER